MVDIGWFLLVDFYWLVSIGQHWLLTISQGIKVKKLRSFRYQLLKGNQLVACLELVAGLCQFDETNLQELDEEDESLDDESDKEKDIKPENKVQESKSCLLRQNLS